MQRLAALAFVVAWLAGTLAYPVILDRQSARLTRRDEAADQNRIRSRHTVDAYSPQHASLERRAAQSDEMDGWDEIDDLSDLDEMDETDIQNERARLGITTALKDPAFKRKLAKALRVNVSQVYYPELDIYHSNNLRILTPS